MTLFMRLLGGCAASKADAEELVRLEVSPDTPTSSVPIRVESQHFVRLLSWRLRTKWDLPTGKSVWLLATRSILALLLSTVCVYYVWPPRPFLDDPGGFWRHRACDLPTAKADFPAYARANCSIVSTSRDVDLAVAIPLVARQQEALLASLQTWSQKKPSPLQATRFDVILFVSTTQGQLSPSIEHQIGKAATAAGAHSFQSTACALSHEQDAYPLGTWVQFLLILEQMHNARYTAFLLCEPDVRVLRAGWMDALQSTLATRERWWMRGSAWLHNTHLDDRTAHVNGNALYRADDARFLKFVWLVLGAGITIRIPTDSPLGFDHTLRLALEGLCDCAAHRWLLDRFVYSSLIINLSLGPCMNDSEINEAFPSAHLAHYNPQRCDTHAVKYHTS